MQLSKSVLSLPSIYGLGTGLPVVLFAVLLAAGASWIGTVYDRIRVIELWARRVTAVLILLVGIHYMLAYTLPALGLDTGWGS
jgi:cytochrome c-type biogenesis protein